MVWDRNDEIFATQASRLRVSEPVIEAVVLAMMWGGEKGFGNSAVHRHIDFIIRQTLGHIQPAGGFGKEILDNPKFLIPSVSLAICSATER